MGIQAIPVDSPVHRVDFFKKIVDSLKIGVIISDREGRIIYINDTYARFLDIDPLAEVGKHATDVVANTRLHIVAKTGQMEINYPHQFKEHGFLVHRVPIKENDQVIAVVGLVLFDSASTASRLAERISHLQSKVHLYENELLSLRSTRYTMDSIVGASRAMTALKWQAMKAAATSLPVVIVGESGTGKELFAQAVHNASPRKVYPFVRVNCAAIRGNCSSPSCSATTGGLSPAPRQLANPARSNWPIMGPFFSTKSATCRSRCSRSCCGCWRKRTSSGSAGRVWSSRTSVC